MQTITGTPADPAALTPAAARAVFRTGLSTPTSGWCAGATQANLIAVPREYAYDLLLFTQRNAQACPVLDVTEPGDPRTSLAEGADLRTDLPAYRVYKHGEFVAETTDATEYWRDDLVAFLIGCSFTFEQGLLDAGIPVRHLSSGKNVPMYRTNRLCRPAGRIQGPLVVSMRAIPAAQVATAVQITSRYPRMHGAPVHVGDPAGLGIAALDQPDYGDAPITCDGDVPVFWACGVTPQAAAVAAKLPFAISHAPGQMLITDVADTNWSV
ncbi:putative hydro-lyase [Planosporangium mesophilum]|uniref:putative hydro-lyase n=1 Tax=Planosporangium mesophilum TaxID=689768 RepID=UPI001EF16DA9|nr:putative hydro-lyase [Planosporangium mesophilum]